MKETRASRRPYLDSCKVLQEIGYLEKGDIPPMPGHRPVFDDKYLGVRFFRTFVAEGDMANMTLPRTYFARSEVGPVSFKNTDLSESTLCWNDFSEVDFSDADLSRCDLRASNFKRVVFVRANLQDSDLRRSSFEDCDFTEAVVRGAKLTHDQVKHVLLSERQRQEIDWHHNEGDEPPGG